MMVISGVDLATVKDILGVYSLKMVMRYIHPTNEGKMNAVKALEKKMEEIDKHHPSTEVKVVTISKAVSTSNENT
jgi:hypothetical protein